MTTRTSASWCGASWSGRGTLSGRRSAIGTVTNLAARLCSEAKGSQILVSSRVATAVEDLVEAEEVGALALKGLTKPVATFNVLGLKKAA